MPENGDVRYEVFWFIHAVVIDGVIEPDSSRFERQYFWTLDDARAYVEGILPLADRHYATIQQQEFSSELGDWMDFGDPVVVQG